MSFAMNHPLKLTVRKKKKRAKELSEETTEISENAEGLDSCLDMKLFIYLIFIYLSHIYRHAYFQSKAFL